MGVTPHPTQIRFDEDQKLLTITFSDGAEHEYRTAVLRGYCPCAHCQGHGSLPHRWNPVDDESQIAISDVSQVGSYAICIAWEDGHNTGVYSFDMLRTIAEDPDSILEDYPPEELGE